jgi:hypothetical protein
MSLQVSISGPGIDLLKSFDKQVKFATAATLTQLAGKSQDAVDLALEKEFHIRGPWWKHTAKHGIKIKKATKTDLESQVKTSADWLLEAEGYAGGVKVPDQHSGHLVVPVTDKTTGRIEARVGGSIQGKVSKANRPRTLLNNPAAHAFKINTKSGYTLIVQRKGKKLKTLYLFKRSVRVPHQSAVVDPTLATVKRELNAVWQANLEKAIKTAK